MKEPVNSSDNTLLDACFSGLADSTTALALATVIQAHSPTSGKPGDKALVSTDRIVEGWIGGGCAQPAVIEAARSALNSGQSSVIRVGPKGEWQALDGVVDFTSGCLSGGTLVIFIEPMIRQPTLTILGNSPAAHSLAHQASHLGFRVTLASPDLDSEKLPPQVQGVFDFSEVNGDFLVIATQGKHDRAALKAAVSSNNQYITMIASSKKIAGLKESLEKSGISANDLESIHSPAGIQIGAVTPSEIALSVLADLVRIRRASSANNVMTPAMVTSPVTATVSDTENKGCCGG